MTRRAVGLAADDVVVRTDGRDLVGPVSLEVAPGQVVALLGANGTGKTTLLRAMAGLVAPSSGCVRVEGDERRAAHRRHAAYLPQSARAAGWRDAIGNAALPLQAAGLDRRTARRVAREALEAGDPELLARAGRRSVSLSGGERQRLLLAGVLALGRPYVLLDEPLAAVDAIARQHLTARIRGAAAAGRGVLLVTHDPHEAALIADRMLVLSGRPGQIADAVFAGPTEARSPSERGTLAATLLGMLETRT